MNECVKRGCLFRVDEVVADYLMFPEADKVSETNGGYKKFGFKLQKCGGWGDRL